MRRIALTINAIDIAGVPGTGKTATVHAVIKQLRARAEEGVSDIWLRYNATTVSLTIVPSLRTYYLSPTSRLTVSKSRCLNMPIQYYGRRFPVKRSPTRRPPCEGWKNTSVKRGGCLVLVDLEVTLCEPGFSGSEI